jgi:hypothetical protein
LVWRSAAATGLSGPHFPSTGHTSAAGEIEIGAREAREHLRAVLGDATVADLAVTELALSTRNTCSTLARTLPKRRFLARWRCVKVSLPGLNNATSEAAGMR